MENKISIIVPVYNVAEYLPKCLDSLVNQTYKNIEIICVNDGSTDNSLDILRDYESKYTNIKVLSQNNGGVSKARNLGLESITGDYVMFVDSDDWVDTTICEELISAILENNSDASMCSYIKEYNEHNVVEHIFKESFIWKDGEFKDKFYRRLFGLVGEETREPEKIDAMIQPWCQLYKKNLVEKKHFIDIKKIGSFEDGLFQMDVYKDCNSITYIDKPFYHYRKTNANSIITKYNPNLFDKWQNLYEIIENIIRENNYSEIYYTALNNRILFGLIGLGLNEISAKTNIFNISKRLKYILNYATYKKAFEKLDMTYMPIKWKVFFILCKYKLTLSLVILLKIIDYLRKK